MGVNERIQALQADLQALHEHLRAETLERYGRMNPFVEDLFDWKERGRAWTKDDRGITIYNSTTVHGDPNFSVTVTRESCGSEMTWLR